MSGYQYNGKLKGVNEAKYEPPKPRYRPQPTHPCGTKAAYNRHKRRGEDACQPCKEAKRLADRKPCGTEAAYQRHRRNNEIACAACLEAHAEYAKERSKGCGSVSGAMRHSRLKEAWCEPCKQAAKRARASRTAPMRIDRTEFARVFKAGASRDEMARMFECTPKTVNEIRRNLDLPLFKDRVPTGCGTYPGVATHARRNEPLCEPCKVARTTYRREHRRKARV